MILKKEFDNFEVFHEFALANKIILFDFYADWCEPCKMLDEILKELEKEISSDVIICKIDIDQNQNLQKHFAIMSVPTLMIFKNGNLEWRMPGFELMQDLKKRIDSFMV